MLFDEVWCGALNLADGFANDLDVADNRVLNLPVLLKGFEVWHRLKIAGCAVDGFRNMFQIVFKHVPGVSSAIAVVIGLVVWKTERKE